MSAQTKTSMLYILPAIAALIAWYMLICVGNFQQTSLFEALRFNLFESYNAAWFRWFLALPFLCLFFSAAYLSSLSRSCFWSAAFFTGGAILAIASWLTVAGEVAFFVTLPLSYGFISAKQSWL